MKKHLKFDSGLKIKRILQGVAINTRKLRNRMYVERKIEYY